MSSANESNGIQKVAAFLLSLDREVAAGVIKRLDPGLVSVVASAMCDLDEEFQDPKKVDALYSDLARSLHERRGSQSQPLPDLRDTLETAYGSDRANEVVKEIEERQRHERPFAFLETRTPESVASLLSEESPAVIALVLAHVPPEFSAEVLGAVPDSLRVGTVKRMASLVPPGIQVLMQVADQLENRIDQAGGSAKALDPTVRHKTIAEMLKFSEPAVEKSVLEGLEADNQEMVENIREFMFSWLDLAEVDKRMMQKILATVDTQTLSIALKACQPEVENNIMKNLSSRVRDMVADERELAGPTPMTDVLAARQEMLRAVRGLIESGELQLQRSGEELVE